MTRKKAGIYTRKGDGGQTSLADRTTVSKNHYRIQALGAIDELNSLLGLICAYCTWSEDIKFYRSVQSDLFVIGAIVAGAEGMQTDQDRVAYLEEMIDEISSKLQPLNNFILPGGTVESAWLHQARSVCRRVEIEIVTVQELDGTIDSNILVYINRLSDLFFVMARKHNKLGKDDILWRKESPLKGT